MFRGLTRRFQPKVDQTFPEPVNPFLLDHNLSRLKSYRYSHDNPAWCSLCPGRVLRGQMVASIIGMSTAGVAHQVCILEKRSKR